MKTTAVSISKAAEIKGKWYFGSDNIVPEDAAEELIAKGYAKALDTPTPQPKAEPKVTPELKAPKS